MPTTRRPGRAVAIAAAVAAAAALVLYLGFRHAPPLLHNLGSGCQARANGQVVPLAPSQAGIAATIAGVAQQRALPPRAVTVAYATAWQESKLQNLPYGDRDSVGIFQQRPSEGWGPRRLLLQPVYAAGKFFDALVTVPRYLQIPVFKAAQAVQHSADGSAYEQYTYTSAVMSRAFSGRQPHAVWCWYGSGVTGRARLAAAAAQLHRAFGPVPVTAAAVTAPGRPALTIAAGRPRHAWAEAAWLVANAPAYGIRQVRYAGLEWSAAAGQKGWQRPRPGHRAKPPPGTVVLG